MIQAQVDQAYQEYQKALGLVQEADRAYAGAAGAALLLKAELERYERSCDRLLRRYLALVEVREKATRLK